MKNLTLSPFNCFKNSIGIFSQSIFILITLYINTAKAKELNSLITPVNTIGHHINLGNADVNIFRKNGNLKGNLLITNCAELSSSYSLKISGNFTAGAFIRTGMIQTTKNAENTMTDNQHDTRIMSNLKRNQSNNFFDLCAGIFAYSNSIYGGFAVSHLTIQGDADMTTGTSRQPEKYTVHGGVIIPLGETLTGFNGEEKEFSISPNILLQKQGKTKQFNIGSYFKKSAFVCGAWFRGNIGENYGINNKSVISFIGIQKGMVNFGYSFDISINQISSIAAGIHEVSISLSIPEKDKNQKKFRALHCLAL